MATLTSEYQYIGRSSKLAPQSGSYGYYILLYAKTSPNQTTGFHSVTIKQVLACTINSSFYSYGTTYSGTINGTTAFSGSNEPNAAWELGTFTAGGVTYKKSTSIGEGSVSVDCTSGIAKDISISTTWKFTATGTTYTPSKNATGTVSATVTLAAIPRESTITATDANIGATSTLILNIKNSSYVHSIWYKPAGQTEYINIVRGLQSSTYGWAVPTSLYELIPNKQTIVVGILCETYNNGTLIGDGDYCEMTATAARANCAPDVTVTAQDVNTGTTALTGNASKIIRGFSDIQVTTTATAKNSATISTIAVKCGSKTGTGASCTITGADSATVETTATDSRGYPTTAQAEGLTLIEYIPLTVSMTITKETPTSDAATIAIKGNYFNGSFGATNNTLSAKVRIKPSGGSYGSYTDIPVTITVTAGRLRFQTYYIQRNTKQRLQFQTRYMAE